MRIPWILLMSFLFAVSCKPVLIVGHRPTPVAPFVLLTDSTRIAAKEVSQDGNLVGMHIVVDNKAFEGKEVSTYSNGKETYSNWQGIFHPLIATGKINVYSNFLPSGNQLLVQNKKDGHLAYFGYRSLRRNIAPGEPGFNMLQRYNRTKAIFILTTLGGLACFVGGALVSLDSGTSGTGNSKTNKAAAVMFGGLGIVLGSSITLFANRTNLKRALATHNGVYP